MLIKLEINACIGQAVYGFIGMVLAIFRDQFFRDFIVDFHPHRTLVHLPYHTKHKLLSHEFLNDQILRKHQEKNGMKEQIFSHFRKNGGKFNHLIFFTVENFSSFKGKI